MLVSVFSPTNDPTWLREAHASLRKQTFRDFEWVVAPNGGCGRLPGTLARDKRVRAIRVPEFADVGKVGALKRFAASQCRGDVLVELDHDDLLAPTALAEVVKAVEGGAGFVYSDFVQLAEDGTCRTFGPEWGWETYPAEVDGRVCEAVRAFPPTAASLAHVWWAPNHVRAWTREAYEATGGHDADLRFCDDLDLVARTYLAGVEFRHIPRPLYVYRIREGATRNSYLQYNDEVQRLDRQVSNRHFYPLIDEWCRREGLAKLEAAGPGLLEGVPAGSAGVIRAYDVLHRVHPEHVPAVLNSYYDALAPGGWLLARVPSTDSQLAFADPTARSHWNRTSWWFYTRAAYASRVPGLRARFQECRSWDDAPTDWDRAQGQVYSHADLCCLRGQRQPGAVHI